MTGRLLAGTLPTRMADGKSKLKNLLGRERTLLKELALVRRQIKALTPRRPLPKSVNKLLRAALASPPSAREVDSGSLPWAGH